MEDVAVTIFRIVIIAVFILSFVKRDKRKRTADRSTGPESRPMEIPMEPQMSRPQQPLRKDVKPAPQRVQVVEVDPAEAEAMAAEYYKKRTYTPVTGKNEPAHGHAEPEEGDHGDFAAQFNLRDAVLYSEILKPKFDD